MRRKFRVRLCRRLPLNNPSKFHRITRLIQGFKSSFAEDFQVQESGSEDFSGLLMSLEC
jgi:hypothetical protein